VDIGIKGLVQDPYSKMVLFLDFLSDLSPLSNSLPGMKAIEFINAVGHLRT